MIKNGKYFQPPLKDDRNFKELFKHLASAGAGRPVDKDGFPKGSWTADLLAEAITQINPNGSGIDLRTIQLWFQDNEKGISTENIRWLARVFGCDDPETTSKWQAELSAAQARLVSMRRERRRQDGSSLPKPPEEMRTVNLDGDTSTMEGQKADLQRPKKRLNLAARSEALFSGTASLNLPIAIWAFGGLLWLLIYIVGVHSITYSPIQGESKQVGFLWAPSWTVDRMILIPLFVIAVARLLNFWKRERPSLLVSEDSGAGDGNSWPRRVGAFSFSFWAILVVCLTIVFLIQWSGVYLRPLMRGTVDNAMIDWILIALVRPDVVTIAEAIVLSGLANLYSAFAYWCYFTGLLLLYMIIDDYHSICSEPKLVLSDADRHKALEIGTTIVRGAFRCSILGLFSATCIKLNAVYLISDTENILIWLINDTLTTVGLRDEEWGWLTQRPSAFMTSFFVLFITCFIFFICLAQTYRIMLQFSTSKDAPHLVSDQKITNLVNKAKTAWLKMIGVVILLAANFLLIGQFTGFSILLVASVLIAISSLFGRA